MKGLLSKIFLGPPRISIHWLCYKQIHHWVFHRVQFIVYNYRISSFIGHGSHVMIFPQFLFNVSCMIDLVSETGNSILDRENLSNFLTKLTLYYGRDFVFQL